MAVEEVVDGVREAEEEVGEIGMVSHGWVSGVEGGEGEVGWTREAIGGEGEVNGILTGGRKVRGMSGREGKDGGRGREAPERQEEGMKREMGGVGRLIGKEVGTGGPQKFLEEEGRALQMVYHHLQGEALKGQDLHPGECEGPGKGGGGRRGGGGRTEEGGEKMRTRTTTCWRAATQSRPMTGMRRAEGRSS